jgi:hypothetical protein
MIWKYELDVMSSGFIRTFSMPKNAVILSAQVQQGKGVLWAMVDTNAKAVEPRRFHLVLTGQVHDPASGLRFIDTLQFDDGNYVVHVFEEV